MKKYLSIILACASVALGLAACQMPDYDYKGSTNPQYPDATITGYSVTAFSSSLTDVTHPTFGVSADRESLGSTWVTRKCTYETSSPQITVSAYTGENESLKSCAMVVTASAAGTITVTYPAPIGDKTGTTIIVNYAEETGAVALVPTNN